MRYLVIFLLVLFASYAAAFYLPGVAPRKFREREAMHIRITTMTSKNDDLRRDYYSLKFCRPNEMKENPENLGELLVGERSEASVFEVNTLIESRCKLACSQLWNKQNIEDWIELADDEYRVNMRLDNLPLAELFDNPDPKSDGSKLYLLGYALGLRSDFGGDANEPKPPAKESKWIIFNHVTFNIYYHRVNSTYEDIESSGILIVGFEVTPHSIQHEGASPQNDWTPSSCKGDTKILDPVAIGDGETEIFFTYDVLWHESDIKWASRWDVFLKMQQVDLHWFSVINSFVVLTLLSGMVAMIMTRILRKDLNRYNRLPETEEERDELREETGWKLVSGDVFRAPPYAHLLAVSVGSGVQVLLMAFFGVTIAALGVLSPANRGGLMSVMLIMFVLMGLPAGYVAAYFCKVLHVTGRFKITILTSILVPGIIFGIFFLLNLLIWGEHSVGAVPFGTIIALCVIWFGVSVPLVFIGSFLGFRATVPEPPVRTNSIPREIPAQPWHLTTMPSVFMGAVLPFGVVFVELFFVLSTIYLHKFYYLFGFMLLVMLMLVITCAEISIVMTYFQLCGEDYRWWWRAFFVPAASALYLLVYSMFYYAHSLTHSAHFIASTVIYFGYACIVAYLFLFLTGAAGFIPTFLFVRAIYGSIKVD